MASNATYVFIDLGTTNDPKDRNIKYITEISMAAVRRDNLLEAGEMHVLSPHVPRVQNKLTLCFNPGLEVLPNGGFNITELKSEKSFDECFDLIDNFINILPEPVYLVAHNGFNFDFPILKTHLKGKKITKELLCADTFYCFYDILENKSNTSKRQKKDMSDLESTTADFAEVSSCETTKQLNSLRQVNADRVESSKGFPWGKKENKPEKSYKLTDIYKRVLKCEPEDAHKGDIDCQLMIRIAVKLSNEFIEWVEKNHSSFEKHVKATSEKVILDESDVNKEETLAKQDP